VFVPISLRVVAVHLPELAKEGGVVGMAADRKRWSDGYKGSKNGRTKRRKVDRKEGRKERKNKKNGRSEEGS
jgi:hypothetical protein